MRNRETRSRWTRWFWLIPIGLGLTLAISPYAAQAQEREWTVPRQLSQTGTSAWFPDVATDASGRVHVVWGSGKGIGRGAPFDTVMHKQSSDGRRWTEANDIFAFKQYLVNPGVYGSEATRPEFFIEEDGTAHLSFRRIEVYYARGNADSANIANSWSGPVMLSGDQIAYFSSLAADDEGRLHILYTENSPTDNCPICYHLYYRRSENDGSDWTDPVDLSKLNTGTAKPQLVVDRMDRLYAVWEAGQGGSYGQLEGETTVMFAASLDGGETWREPVELPTMRRHSQNIALGVEPSGRLIVAWLGIPEDVVYFQTSSNQGRTWTTPNPIPNLMGGWSLYQGRLDGYDMAADSAGDLHLVLVGRREAEQAVLEVLHAKWDGTVWSQPEPIATYEEDVPEWPRIDVALGNQLHVVWFVRDREHVWDSANGEYSIWYSRGESEAPSLNPKTLMQSALPTVEPSTTPAEPTEPIANAEATAIPSLPSEFSDKRIDTEADALEVLALSMIPSAILFALVLIAPRTRNR